MIVRLENLNEVNKTVSVDINAVAMAYWKEANLRHYRAVESIDIQELSITANMPLAELQKRKIDWKTVDDDKLVFEELVNDAHNDIKTLKPMQIRVFSVHFKVSKTGSLGASDSDDAQTEETFIMT